MINEKRILPHHRVKNAAQATAATDRTTVAAELGLAGTGAAMVVVDADLTPAALTPAAAVWAA
jgi:hypothetical protein